MSDMRARQCICFSKLTSMLNVRYRRFGQVFGVHRRNIVDR